MRVAKRVLIAPVAAAVILGGITWFANRGHEGAGPEAAAFAIPVVASRPFDELLADSNAGITAREKRIASPLGDMTDYEALAMAYLGRSKLTGDFGDLVKARDAAQGGIDTSPPGSGTWLAKASAEFAGHRIADAETALGHVDNFVVPTAETRAEALAIRSDIALSRGDYAGARTLLAQVEAIDQWPGLYFRKALLARIGGDFDAARAQFALAAKAEKAPSAAFLSNLRLRLGELDFAQGQWEAARAHYAAADRLTPGNWRTEMRVVQMQAIAGDATGALKVFERLAAAGDNADAMYVAAGLNQDAGNKPRADIWIARAAAVWAKRLDQLPEAAWGHAIEHELAFGTPQRALELAGKNARNRPYGMPQLLLAEAWIANGKPEQALALCRAVAASGWISAEQWKVRAIALDRLGRGSEAKAAREKALAINPRQFDANPALVWFHD